MKKLYVLIVALLIAQFVFAKSENEKNYLKNESQTIQKEAELKVAKVAEIEKSFNKINGEAIKEKDIKWKICLDDYMGTFKGVSVSALNAGTKIKELLIASQVEEAKNQLILLRGLTESAEKIFTESQACERQLTRVDAQTSIIKEVNSEVTGTMQRDSVDDAMGIGFGGEFVADTNKGIVSGSDISDAGGVDSSDVNSESPGVIGESSESQMEAAGIIDVPEVIDVSPTK